MAASLNDITNTCTLASLLFAVKSHFGCLAFDLAAIKELPELHPFPVEVQVMSEHGDAAMDWQGEAWQVIVSKTRSYAGTVDVAPDAYLDDGVLKVCIITAENPIRSLEQAVSLLLRHKPDDTTAKYYLRRLSFRSRTGFDWYASGWERHEARGLPAQSGT